MKEYLKIARPDHWVKNIFIVPGIITALLLVENSWGGFFCCHHCNRFFCNLSDRIRKLCD